MLKPTFKKHEVAIHVCCDSSDDSNDGAAGSSANVESGGQSLSLVSTAGGRGGSSSGGEGSSSSGGEGDSSSGGEGGSSSNVEWGSFGGQDLAVFGVRGNGRRGRGRADFQGPRTVVEPHRFPGIFMVRRIKKNLLLTKNLVPGFNVYGERKISVKTDGEKVEYRVWNPYQSNLAAAILGGVLNLDMPLGARVLYLGASSGITVSHISDIVGPGGLVYAVESSQRSGRELVNIALKRGNIVPIVEDARHALKYRMLLGMVDCIIVDITQRDQADILDLNARLYLKTAGQYVIFINPSRVERGDFPGDEIRLEAQKLIKHNLIPTEVWPLTSCKRGWNVVVGTFRPHGVEN